jgi:periplasmic protein TonB
MAYVEPYEPTGRGELLRWLACGAIVLAAHLVVVLAIVFHLEQFDLEAGAPVVMMELAPISAALPARLSELAPGPQQSEAEPIEQVEEETPKDRQDAEQVPELPQESDPVSLQLGATVLREQTPKTESRELPEPETKEEIHQEAAIAAAPPSAELVDVRPASPAPGLVERPTSTQIVTWQRLMSMQLERYERYPSQARGEQGETTLTFTIDRQGHLLSSRVVQSAGSAALDAAALAMLGRAQPFPPPPVGIADAQLTITVPIRYKVPAQR